MSPITLSAGDLRLVCAAEGGLTLRFDLETPAGRRPLLRPYAEPVQVADPLARALAAASFVMVPFCNRLDGSRFPFLAREWRIAPNTGISPHYLHGDGWLRRWEVAYQGLAELRLRLRFNEPASPYRYCAEQVLSLTPTAHTVVLSVRNEGEHPLPFGLGLHPYFPRLDGVRLLAPFRRWWRAREDYIPTEPAAELGDLDFHQPRPLPDRPVDTGCEGWSRQARIHWPGDGLALDLEASEVFACCHLYQPSGDADFFCFEPVAHITDAHHRPGLPGLAVLAPGETLTGWVRYTLLTSIF